MKKLLIIQILLLTASTSSVAIAKDELDTLLDSEISTSDNSSNVATTAGGAATED